jgi:hypothetical protein
MATDSGANRFCRATLPSPSSPSTASSPHTPSPSGPPSTRARPTQNPCTKRRADSESLHKKANTPAERPGRTHRQNAPTGAPTERTGRTHRRANSESLHKKAGQLRIPAQKGQHTGQPTWQARGVRIFHGEARLRGRGYEGVATRAWLRGNALARGQVG